MTDRREERDGERRGRRQAEEDEERLREERDRRSDELKESWRRNHPSGEEDGKGRPRAGASLVSPVVTRGRPAAEPVCETSETGAE
jgi:hypothetical protein